MLFADFASLRRMPALIAVGSMALAFAPGGAAAQELPQGEVRLVAAFPAGSGSDVVVRWFAEKLKPVLTRTVIVENKPGAGGNIATEYVSRSKPDGSTIYLHTGSSMSANMHVFKKPPVATARAIEPKAIRAGIRRSDAKSANNIRFLQVGVGHKADCGNSVPARRTVNAT